MSKHLAPISIKTQIAEYDAYLAVRLPATGLHMPEAPSNGRHRDNYLEVRDADA